jgi:hypothetical protein
VYRWSLTKDPAVPAATAIAAVCSFGLLAMAVTVVVHRNEADIRMLQVRCRALPARPSPAALPHTPPRRSLRPVV